MSRKMIPNNFQAPPAPTSMQIYGETWQRLACCLKTLVESGRSLRHEIFTRVSDQLNLAASSRGLRDLFDILVQEHLVESRLTNLIGTAKITLVRLTKDGQNICTALGWQVVVSDWTILNRKRSIDTYLPAAALILQFAYHARLRDWEVLELAPDIDSSRPPDLIIGLEGRQMDVYVMGRWIPSSEDWEQVKAGSQGKEIGLVANRKRLAALQKDRAGRSGITCQITNLEKLIREVKVGEVNPLWE